MNSVEYRDLGLLKYKECWEYQQSLFDGILSQRGNGDSQGGHILLVEHPAVYTLGKSGKEGNMLVNESYLREIGAEFYQTDRGGDITFHGEGQLVGYPILDLEKIGIGLRDYIYAIEEAVIKTVANFGIKAGRLDGASGVWIVDGERGTRKVCAIGVKASRFVTMHGFALNVSTDLSYFSHINPCGFVDKGVTSITKEIGIPVSMDRVKELVIGYLEEELKIKIYKK